MQPLRRYYFHDRLSVGLLVCKQDYANTTGWNLMKQNQKLDLGPTLISLNFETDLDHRLDTRKKIQISQFTYHYMP